MSVEIGEISGTVMSWKPSIEMRDHQLCPMALLSPINGDQGLTTGYWQVEMIGDLDNSDRNESDTRLSGVDLRENGGEKLEIGYTDYSFKEFYYIEEKKNAMWQLVGKVEIKENFF